MKKWLLCLSFLPLLQANTLWMRIEEAKRLFQTGHSAAALTYFLSLLEEEELKRSNPEIAYWIGRIYQKDRNFDLAIKQYKEALSAKDQLYDYSDVYDIYYHLADLYRRSGQKNLYEQTLLELSLEERYPDAELLKEEAVFVEQLKSEGLDLMLYAQKLKLNYSESALLQLGLYYYQDKHYNTALNFLCYPVISFFNKAFDFISRENEDFFFPLDSEEMLIEKMPFRTFERVAKDKETLKLNMYGDYDRENLLANIADIRQVAPFYKLRMASFILDYLAESEEGLEFIKEKEIFKNLYFLAASLWANGYAESAQDIWRLLSFQKKAGFWQQRAYAQLLQPFIDDSDLS